VALNSRLGFTSLDTARALVPNMPWPVRSRGGRVVDTPNEIDGLLSGRDQKIYRDHSATAAHQVVLAKGDQSCHVMFRRERRKRLPLFASILYIGNPVLFRDCAPHFYRYLLLRRGIPATLAEVRVVGHHPARSVMVAGWQKMYLSEDLEPAQIDYLYSELTVSDDWTPHRRCCVGKDSTRGHEDEPSSPHREPRPITPRFAGLDL
jgi:hypothetical protein